MSTLDDLPLDPGRETEVLTAPSAPSSPGLRIAAFVALGVTVAAVVWLFVTRSPSTPPATDAAPAPAAVSAADPAANAIALPPLAEMDPMVRGLLSALSSQPALLQWLATDDLVGAIATAIARLGAGDSPARDLAVLRPVQRFAIVRRGATSRADPAGYGRYDALVAAVTNVDATRLAAAFTTIKPRIVEAYAAQGFDAATFDRTLARALGVVVATPDAPADVALTPAVGGFAYADAELERLPAAQRHLLRMGPAHVKAVREATQRFAQALGVTPVLTDTDTPTATPARP